MGAFCSGRPLMLNSKEDLRCQSQTLGQAPFLEVHWKMTGCLCLQVVSGTIHQGLSAKAAPVHLQCEWCRTIPWRHGHSKSHDTSQLWPGKGNGYTDNSRYTFQDICTTGVHTVLRTQGQGHHGACWARQHHLVSLSSFWGFLHGTILRPLALMSL